jgi:hypothetical protein
MSDCGICNQPIVGLRWQTACPIRFEMDDGQHVGTVNFVLTMCSRCRKRAQALGAPVELASRRHDEEEWL